MTKTELIERLAIESNQSPALVGDLLSALLRVVMETVAAGNPVVLPGFGEFKPAFRAARQGANPAIGEAPEILATRRPRFVPGPTFKTLVSSGAEFED